MYVNHTGLDLKTIEENMERDKFMSPIEAKEFGLIDTVLTRPVKTQESSTTAVESSPEQSKDENASWFAANVIRWCFYGFLIKVSYTTVVIGFVAFI